MSYNNALSDYLELNGTSLTEAKMIKYPPGRNEGTVSILISDLRDVLEPPTASSLSESLKMQG